MHNKLIVVTMMNNIIIIPTNYSLLPLPHTNNLIYLSQLMISSVVFGVIFWPDKMVCQSWANHSLNQCHTFCRFATHFRRNAIHYYLSVFLPQIFTPTDSGAVKFGLP